MSGNEFKEFWEMLQQLFPFDFKTEGAMRLWAKHMQSAPYDMAVVAIQRWKRESELVRMNIAPKAEVIADSAKHYCGYSKAFYTGLMRSKRLIEKECEKDNAEEADD